MGQQLHSSLTKVPVPSLYLDQKRLVAGFAWDPQLQDALEASEHLIVLWSTRATASDSYTNEERKTFEVVYHLPSQRNPMLPSRRVIYIQLDAELPPRARAEHAITDLKEAGLYSKGADAVPPDIWNRVVQKVKDSLFADDQSSPVRCVVLASTEQCLAALDSKQRIGGALSLERALAGLGLTQPDFLGRYGDAPEDWRPFGSPRAIRDMLADLQANINIRLAQSRHPQIKSMRVRWEYPRPEFWADWEQAEAEARSWRDQLLVAIVDPLSLYDREIALRLSLITDLLRSGLVTLMVLGPGPIAPMDAALKAIIQREARELHKLFWDPELPLLEPLPLAGVNIDDQDEMQRLLTTTVSNYARLFLPRGAAAGQSIITP